MKEQERKEIAERTHSRIEDVVMFKGEWIVVCGDRAMTVAEAEACVKATAEADYKAGYNDRNNHCYDKWYRYNRWDEGKAYDEGVKACVAKNHSKAWMEEDEYFHFIGEKRIWA